MAFNKSRSFMKLYFRYLFFSLTFTMFFGFSFAQDKGLNFQGVARNSNNVLLASKQISIRFSVIDSTLTSKTVVYSEVKTVSTSAQGLFSTVIGNGNEISKSGDFSTIDWSVKPKYLKIELDPLNGSNFTYLGISQIQYAAFAHFAEGVMAENIKGILPLNKGGTGVGSLVDLKTVIGINNKLDLSDSTKIYVTPNQLYHAKNVNSINGLSDSVQSIVIGNEGLEPSIKSNIASHIINLPLASLPLVTAGLIAKTDYDQFYNKSDFSGNYIDLFNKPIIPDIPLQSDWNQLDTSKTVFIKNKPILSIAAKTGSFNDLIDKPTLNSLGGIPSDRTITINGLTHDLSINRNWVIDPNKDSISLKKDVKDVLPILNGGTGSTTQNFLDLSTNQIVNGVKQFNNSISVGSGVPATSAIVDMNTTMQGFLPPRLNTFQRNVIKNPVIGLTIYNTDTNCLEWWIGSIWYNACGNESISTTSNGSAKVIIVDCLNGTANGIIGGSFDIGTPVNSSNSWQILNVKVSSIGNYNFTATANGITYSAIGKFYESDRLATVNSSKEVYMYASGAAENAGTFSYKLATVPSCEFTNNVNSTSSNGSSVINTWDGSSIENGVLTQGVEISGVSQKIRALVSTTPGTYKIISTQNGITFAGEGNFPTANALYDVVLTATGIPTNTGTYTFTTNTVPAKTFTRTITSPSSNGTAVVSNWISSGISTGSLVASQSIISNHVTQLLIANVISVGTYSVSTSLNGIVFSGTGVFTSTGSQNVVLTASGNPTTIGSNLFSLNTYPSLVFEKIVESNRTSGGTSIVNSWVNSGDLGELIIENPITFVTHTVTAYVASVGTYNISASNNGITFSTIGTFDKIGYQKVVLNATGIPSFIGINPFSLNVSLPCNFTRMVNPNESTQGTSIVDNWSGGTITGDLYVNKLISNVTLSVNADVSKVGTYDLKFILPNGITFTAVGTFTNTGNNTLTYIASGTPNTIMNFHLQLLSSKDLYLTPSISILANPSSNGTANIAGWTMGLRSGVAYKGLAVNNANQNLVANVTIPGTYSISSTMNGVIFASSGTFAGTGSQTITLVASGVPTSVLNAIYTLNTRMPSGSFNYQYLDKSSNGTSEVSEWKVYSINTNLYAASNDFNYLGLEANVTKPGTYSLSTSNNGITYSKIGTFQYIGKQVVILDAIGMGINSGIFNFVTNTVPKIDTNIIVRSYTSNGTAEFSNLRIGNSSGLLSTNKFISNVSQEILVNVVKIGNYFFDVNNNGVRYYAGGNFTSTGEKIITLIASGVPRVAGDNIFILNTTPSISFSKKVQAYGN